MSKVSKTFITRKNESAHSGNIIFAGKIYETKLKHFLEMKFHRKKLQVKTKQSFSVDIIKQPEERKLPLNMILF